MGISVDLEETSAENAHKKDNREEGEIVDDFEDIISSDEEFSMRKRIEELEARNLELEKIANISGIYSCDLGYPSDRYKNGLPALDLSDLSDAEGFPTKSYPNGRIKSSISSKVATAIRRSRYKVSSPVLYKPTRRRSSQSPDYIGRSIRDYDKARKRKHEKFPKARFSRKTTDRPKKKSRFDYTSSEEEFCSLDRDELRMALRHDLKATNPQGNLRNLIKDTTRILNERKDEPITVKDDSDKDISSDDSVSLEEQELRLIALKSAIVKKHLARKKRKEIDEKKPYSPTDFLQPMASVVADTTSPKLFLENDVCNSMDISPIPSPDMLNEQHSIDNSVDMDLVDSSNSSSPTFVDEQRWTPINEIPLPRDRNHETDNCVSLPLPKIISPLPIRPKPILLKQPICVINIDGDDDDADDDEMIEIHSNEASSPEPFDEEASALRALLLAQKNSPKFTKDKDLKCIKKEEPPPPTTAVAIEVNNAVNDEVASKMQGILSIVEGPAHKTAVILKEAVKRLQNKTNLPDTLSHNSLSSDQSDISTKVAQIPNDTLSRLNSPDTNVPPKAIVESILVKTPPVGFNLINGKCVGIKENISIGTRPNNIQIIPTVMLTRNARKSPLTEIAEVDNVKSDIKDFPSSKQETTNIVVKSDIKDHPSCKPEANIVEPPKSPRKQTVPALKALQLKTMSLISAGKLLNPQKTIATKLLNKAIQQNTIQMKRKAMTLQNTAIRKLKTTTNNRLITKVDVPAVKRLIINLGEASETESDDCFDNIGALLATSKASLDDKLYDIGSPMSLSMESPRDSPLTIIPTSVNSSVNAVAANDVGDSVVVTSDVPTSTDKIETTPKKTNDTFQAKLDEFLKNARSKVDLIKKESSIVSTVKPAPTPILPRTNATPLAVRHLPPSSQLEYRRLVNRMQTLEKQKQARGKVVVPIKERSLKVTIKNSILEQNVEPANNKPEPSKLSEKLFATDGKTVDTTTNEVAIKRVTPIAQQLPPIQKEPSQSETVKKTKIIMKPEVESKPIKTITKSIEPEITVTFQAIDETPVSSETKTVEEVKEVPVENKKKTVPTKPNRKAAPHPLLQKTKPKSLSECEKDYKETSSSLVASLSKTIELVVSAKEKKTETLILENQLKELQEKMLAIEQKIKLRKQQIAKIYPEISSSHKTIMELKSKSLQLEKCSVNFGKNLKADKNKLQFELSKKLSAEIKNLKNFKISILKNVDLTTLEENSLQRLDMVDEGVQVDLLKTVDASRAGNESSKEDNDNSKITKGDETEESSFSLSECDTQNVQSSLDMSEIVERMEQVDDSSERIDCVDSIMKDELAESLEDEPHLKNSEVIEIDVNIEEPPEDVVLENLESDQDSDPKNVSSISKYISPLNFSNNEEHINPLGVICPYQLMGQCDDKECKFEHFNS